MKEKGRERREFLKQLYRAPTLIALGTLLKPDTLQAGSIIGPPPPPPSTQYGTQSLEAEREEGGWR